MGFVLKGLHPKISDKPELLEKFSDADNYTIWSEVDRLPEKDKKQYQAERKVWFKENPGVEFSAPAWHWKPMWYFIYNACGVLLSLIHL